MTAGEFTWEQGVENRVDLTGCRRYRPEVN